MSNKKKTTGIQETALRIPDAWSAAWFRMYITDFLSKADVRNAIGVGIEITSVRNSVATLTVTGEGGGGSSSSLDEHNDDPFAHANAFAAHNADANAHLEMQQRLSSQADCMAFFLGV